MARTGAARVLAHAASVPWALAPGWSETLRSAIELVHVSGASSPEELRDRLRAVFAPHAKPGAVAVSLGEPLEGARRARVRDGVAIVSVMGPLWHYANFMTDICGDTAYEELAADLRAVMEARAAGTVKGCLLETDSPGGVVAGCGDTAALVRELAAVMPVHSLITGQGCSAAYYLASAASRVYVARGSLTGCLGTVCTFRIRKGRDDEEVVEIVSSQTPKKRFDPRTEEGQAQARTWIDDLASEFLEDVAAYRGRTVEDVLENFGQGDVMTAARAVAAGLADEIGSFESVLAGLAAHEPAAPRGTPARGGTTAQQEHHIMSVVADKGAPAGQRTAAERATTFAAEHADAAAILRAEGADGERARILAIDAATPPGAEAVVAPLKADPTKGAGDAALAIVAAAREGTITLGAAQPEKPGSAAGAAAPAP
ncbi:MAG: S49 family peptidase, partial [Gemmatimonadota bacterium]